MFISTHGWLRIIALKSRRSPFQRIIRRRAGRLPEAENLPEPLQSGSDSKEDRHFGSSTEEGDLLDWAQNALDNTPGVRSELVRSLQIQIEAGLFSLDIELLAEKLIPHVCRPLVLEEC